MTERSASWKRRWASALLAGSAVVAFLPAPSYAQQQPIVKSRMIRDFARLSFQWPQEVRFRAETGGNTIRLVFEQPVTLQSGSVLQQMSPYVIGAEQSADLKTLTLTTDKPYKTRSFLSGNTSGIDLLGVGEKASPAPVPPTVVAQDEPVAPPEKAPVTPQPEKQFAPKRVAALPQSKPVSAEPESPPAAEIDPKQASAATAEPVPTAAETEPPAPASTDRVRKQDDTLVVTMPFVKPTAAAAFRRAGRSWVAFSAPNISLPASPLLPPATRVEAPGASVYAIDTPLSGISLRRPSPDSAEWQIVLTPRADIPSQPLPIQRLGGDKPYLFIDTDSGGSAIAVTDPIVGDQLTIVPVTQARSGLAAGQELIDATILPTAQGIAIARKDETVEIDALRDGVKLSKPSGLLMSAYVAAPAAVATPDVPETVADTAAPPAEIPDILFPKARWRAPEGKSVAGYEQELIRADTGPENLIKQQARLRLAQFYLAYDRPQEASAMLELIRSNDPKYYTANYLRALRGGADFLSGRFEEAALNFSHESLNDWDEVTMWRNALAMLLKGGEDFDYMAALPDYLVHYPDAMRQRLALIAANQLIGKRQFNQANRILDSLKGETPPESIAGQIAFLRGKILADSGQLDAAKAVWNPLISGTDPYISSSALFALTNIELQKGEIGYKDAIKELEPLRIRWRGDALEVSVLQLLGELYEETKDYPSALRAYRELTTYYPKLESSTDTAQRMTELFIDLFNNGGADPLPPLEALALYYEFRELTPIEAEGDKMIRNLADRLIGVDLLDRGAALLQHQVQYRLTGEERSRVGARLALVYLLNRQPKQALDVLELTGFGQNGEELRQTRALLTARALGDLNEPERAIRLLEGDDRLAAQQLKLAIFWENKKWPEVIKIGEDIMSRRPDPTKPINPQEAETLNKLAIAYIFEQQDEQLDYLRDYFLPLMPDSASRKIFSFVTDDAPVDYKSMARLTAHLGKVESFLGSYKTQLKEQGLSKVIP